MKKLITFKPVFYLTVLSLVLSNCPVSDVAYAEPVSLAGGSNALQPVTTQPGTTAAENSAKGESPAGIIGVNGVPEGPLAAATANDVTAYPFYNYHSRLAIARSFRDQLYYLIGKNPAEDEHKWAGIFRVIVGDPASPNAPAPLPTYRRMQAAVMNNMDTLDDGTNRYSVLLENRIHLGPVSNPNRSQEEKYHLYLFYNLEMDQLGQIPQGEAGEARFQQFKSYINQVGLEKAILYFYVHDPKVIERNLRDRAQQFGIAELGSPETGQPRLTELMSITYQSGYATSLYGRNLSIAYHQRYENEIEATIKAAKFNIYSCLLPIAAFTPYIDLGSSTKSGAELMNDVDIIWRNAFITPQLRAERVIWFTNTLDAIITGNLAVINGVLQPAQTRTPQILQILAARGIDIYSEPSFIRIAQVVTDIIMNGAEYDAVNNRQFSFKFNEYERNLDFQDWIFPVLALTDKREPADPDHPYFISLVNATMTGHISPGRATVSMYLKRENDVRLLYPEVLGREASYEEIVYYAKKPSLPISLLREGLRNSLEGQVVSLYRTILGRQPGPAEVGHWLTWLQSNPNGIPAIAIGLSSGHEGRIVALYRTILGRQPAPTEVGHWLIWLQSNPNGIPAIEIGLRRSQIVSMYQTILGRQPADTEISHWVNWLRANPNGIPAIAIGLTSSPEGQVVGLYRNILGRQPGAGEVGHWLVWLQSNPNGIPAIAIGLTNSHEGRIVAMYRTILGRQPAPTEVGHWLLWLVSNPYGLPAIEIGLRNHALASGSTGPKKIV